LLAQAFLKQTALTQELNAVKTQVEDLQREKVLFSCFTPKVTKAKNSPKIPNFVL